MHARVRREELEGRILAVIAEILVLESTGIRLDAALKEDLGASSLDRMTLMMALEDEFGGSVAPEDAQHIKTVAQVIDYIEGRLASA